jgi:hypothetical protein
MGISPNQFRIIWEAIYAWMKAKDTSPAELSRLTGYPVYRIEKGIKEKTEWLTSDFVHACVDVFGLRNARNRSFEDIADVLTDEECIQLLTSILTIAPRQGKFWD